MATAVDAALVEVEAALASIAPQIEGLEDFSRLNLLSESRVEIDASIQQYRRRRALLQAANDTLTALVGDGYPVLDVREISQKAFADLQDNKSTIDAALAQFSPVTAVSLNFTAGEAEPKP